MRSDSLTGCMYQAGNGFTQADVTSVYNRMIQLRSPGLGAPAGSRAITGQDRPFLGLGTGNLPFTDAQNVFDDGTPKAASVASSSVAVTTGIEDTLLRSFAGQGASAGADRLFDVPAAAGTRLHPYQKTELMRKIYGHLTTRSNVFAVWCTIGFFRVADESVRPAKLAEEVGAADGASVRHRFFAVIDRSQMAIAPQVIATVAGTDGVIAAVPTASPNTPNVPDQLTAVRLNYARPTGDNGPPCNPPGYNGDPASLPAGFQGIPWIIQPGTVLVIDAGAPNEETVVVQPAPVAVTLPGQANDWIWATFRKEHGATTKGNVSITIPGHPGPRAIFPLTGPALSGGAACPWLIQTYAVFQ